MAARKLATEIERTLKKVAEGVAGFEELYDKMQASTNQTQKEKMEAELKTQIKKLQRLRDQIKTWLQSNDIKDKKPLMDNRKLIETQMERFKACEKEMKTKAFSKEGLIAAAKMDPAERAKADLSNWLSSSVDELSHQVEGAEAELETLAGGGKKKKGNSGANERIGELERLNERREWHVQKLEVLLRLLENGQLETDAVAGIKDDIAYFVESNADEDFEEDEGIYDDFNLEEEEEALGLRDNDDVQSSHDGASVAEEPTPPTPPTPKVEKAAPKKKEPEEAAKKSTPARKASDVASSSKEPRAAQGTPSKASAVTASPSALSAAAVASPPRAPSQAALPPIRYAAAAAAAVSPSSTSAPAASASASSPVVSAAQMSEAPSQPSPPPSSVLASSDAPMVTASPSPSHAQSVSAPSASEGVAKDSPASTSDMPPSPTPAPPGLGAQSLQLNGSSQDSPAAAHASALPGSVDAAPGAPLDGKSSGSSVPEGAAAAAAASASASAAGKAGAEGSQAASEFQPAQLAASSAAAGVVQPLGGGAGTSSQRAAAQRQQGTEARLPSSLADLVSSFESAKHKSMNRTNDLTQVHESLESSALGVPEPQDSDAPRYYRAQNPWPSPAWYPQTPLNIFDNPALYSKLEEDTLFYIFYYSQRDYHRYLAANELKRQSWRFSMRFGTWFQRYSQPVSVTAEYEEGSYIYFDFETSWSQRRKQSFRFEYVYLAP